MALELAASSSSAPILHRPHPEAIRSAEASEHQARASLLASACHHLAEASHRIEQLRTRLASLGLASAPTSLT